MVVTKPRGRGRRPNPDRMAVKNRRVAVTLTGYQLAAMENLMSSTSVTSNEIIIAALEQAGVFPTGGEPTA